MIKIVITGASGFLGSNLIKRLETENNIKVIALSSKPRRFYASNVVSVDKDIIDCNDVGDILNGAIVVNCAFPRNSTGTELADGLAYINRLFVACRKHRVNAIINISSQSVYSQKRKFPADETTEVCLETPYSVGKYATELMVESICGGTDIAYTNLRMASLIGPDFDQRIVNRLVKKALALEAITITLSDQRFGFLDICDAVEAIVSLISAKNLKWRKVYNVGNGEAVSLKDIISSIEEVFTDELIAMPDVSVVQEAKSGSTAVTYQRLHEDTGYIPQVSLKMSIYRILNSLKLDSKERF